MSIFDAPDLPEPNVPEERLVYSIWVGNYNQSRGKMFEVKVSDSWNVIQRYWEIQKWKLRKSNPFKDGYIVAELRFWRTNGFVWEQKTNRKGYLIKVIHAPGENVSFIQAREMEFFVNKYKQALHYAIKFKKMGNKVEIHKCNSAKLNSWILVDTFTPVFKPKGSLIVVQNDLALIPGRNYDPAF